MADDEELFDRLSAKLADLHRRVATLSDEGERDRVSRRLIAITNAAKHDLPTASARADVLLRELGDAGGNPGR